MYKRQVLAEIGSDLELVPNVKARKLKYYGHIMRSEDEKDVVVGAVPGSRSKGRPRRRWVQDVEDWLKMTINDAAKLTGERSTWRKEVLPVNDGWHLT